MYAYVFNSWLRYSVCSLLFCLLASWPQASQAFVFAHRSEQQIVVRSQLLVQGTVQSTKSIWGPKRRVIVTLVTLRVEEEVVGRKSRDTVTFRHLGGSIGARHSTHGPRFKVGEKVLVALQRSPHLPQNQYLLVSWMQGIWRIIPAQSLHFSGPPQVIPSPRPKLRHNRSAQKLSSLWALKSRLKQHWQTWSRKHSTQPYRIQAPNRPALRLQIKPLRVQPKPLGIKLAPRKQPKQSKQVPIKTKHTR
ncbi:MAG: hypothetical protein AAGJ35_07905 [Myxococcota bacterium]